MRSIRIKAIVAILFLSLAVTTVCGFLPGLFMPVFAAKTEQETVLPDGAYELNMELWQSVPDAKGGTQLKILSVQKAEVALTNSDAPLLSVVIDPLQLISAEAEAALQESPDAKKADAALKDAGADAALAAALKKAINKSPLKKSDLEKTAKLFPEALITLVPEETADFGLINIEYELDKNISLLIGEAEQWLPVTILFEGQDEETAYKYYLKTDWTSLEAITKSDSLSDEAVPETLARDNIITEDPAEDSFVEVEDAIVPDVTTIWFHPAGSDSAVNYQMPAKVLPVALPEEEASEKEPEPTQPIAQETDPQQDDDAAVSLQDLEDDDPYLELDDLDDLDDEDFDDDFDDEDFDDEDDGDLELDDADDEDFDDDEEYDAFFDIGDEIMELEDDKTGIIIQYADGSIPNEPDDLDIAVNEIKTGASYTAVASNANTRGKKFSVYNIRLSDGQKDYVPTTRALVYVPIPSGWDGTKMIAYLIGNDGSLEALEGGLEDDYFVFSTTTWGNFAIVEDTIVHNKAVDYDVEEVEEEETTTRSLATNYTTSPTTTVSTPNAKTGDTANMTLWIILAAAAVVVVIVAILLLKRKQKNNDE